MSEVKFNLLSSEETGIATLLQGDAPVQKPLFRSGTKISGTITVPADHLEKPSNFLTEPNEGEDSPLQYSFVQVNREDGVITFTEDKGYPWESEYKGALKYDERFVRFEINTGKTFVPHTLGTFFKMNRSFFESIAEGSRLASLLMNFEADIEKKVKEADDGRANTTSLKSQIVTTNLPPAFNLNVPIFKGLPKQLFEVEVYIDSRTLNCSLVSPQANDYIETIKDDVINKEIKRIREYHPLLRIFEI